MKQVFIAFFCAMLFIASPEHALATVCDYNVVQTDIPNNLTSWLQAGNKTLCFQGLYNMNNWPYPYHFEVASGTKLIGLSSTQFSTKQSGALLLLSVGGVASSDIEISGISFDNPPLSIFNPAGSTAIQVGASTGTAQNISIENCAFNRWGYALAIARAANVIIKDISTADTTSFGISAGPSVSDLRVLGSSFTRYGSYGIYIASCTNCEIFDNGFNTGAIAFRLDHGTNVSYARNGHSSCNTSGNECILLYLTSAAPGNMERVTLEGNTFSWPQTKNSVQGVIYVSAPHPTYRVKDLAIIRSDITSIYGLGYYTDFLVFGDPSHAQRVVYVYNDSSKVKNAPSTFLGGFP